ncbi:MAG TPA: chromosomal replication initiator protein DnaA [Roseiflexaceae bacterium]|nr:chromosomal replication initiator protein DnaA [Roseiflexaceae bacterium]
MSLAKIWNTALGTMQVQTSRHEFTTWLKPANLVAIEHGVATIGVPSSFYKEKLENSYISPLRELISDLVGVPVQIRVVIAPQMTRADVKPHREYEQNAEPMHGTDNPPIANGLPTNGVNSYTDAANGTNGYADNNGTGGYAHGNGANNYANGHAANGHSANPQERRTAHQLELSATVRTGMLNARYTFDRFIVGSSNRLANAACMAVAEHPAQAYNPLFLYGGVGLGKTHLLHAIGNYALDRDPEVSILYVSSEKFTNDMINSIRRQQNEEFRMRYRNIDILLIDDIQFIAGKEGTQEEFFHTFNALHSAGKQIVISSDRPPKAIVTLEERLRSRFEWGLIVDVQMPDLETRTAILRAKAEQMFTPIPAEVIDFLAHRIQSNIRELEGSLNRVVAYAQMYNTDVSVDVATAALSDLLDTTRRRRITADAIIREVSDFYGVDVRTLQGRGRSRNIVVPRQVAMYLIREETDASLMDIGQMLGGRDHTTVIYGCDKIGEEITSDSRLRQEVMTIRERLYQGQSGA